MTSTNPTAQRGLGEEQGVGWIAFASFMLVLGGIFAVIYGIVLLTKDELVIFADGEFIFSNFTFWGWTLLIVGVVSIIAGVVVFGGSEWARWFGIAIATISAIWNLLWLPVFPIWAIIVIVLDVLVIYALAVYGGNPELDDA